MKQYYQFLNNKFTTVFYLFVLIVPSLIAQTFDKPLAHAAAGEIIAKNLRGAPSTSLRGAGMMFTENKGQVIDSKSMLRPDVLFKGNGAGADVYIRKTGISYVYSNMGEVMRQADERVEDFKKSGLITSRNEQEKRQALINSMPVKVHRVDMEFDGGNINTEVIKEDVVEGSTNYYYPHCPNGITNVHQYNKVTCKNIYNNIDVKYYGDKQSGVKYDLVVQPHANPSQIKLRWKGAESLRINNDGNLVIKTSVNEFYESIPKVYQVINGEIVDVKARYILNGTTINFELETWNPEHSLIIDPATWITYYGGNNDETSNSVATDDLGNAIFTGITYSVNFPVSAGAYQTTIAGGGYDAYVVKMNGNGNRVFATYFGGSGTDNAIGIDADGNGNIYITGSTSSLNLPIVNWAGAYMQAAISGGGSDAFIAKFSPAGTVTWSTYYGGVGSDQGIDIITDSFNNIIFIGGTTSSNFPLQSPYQSSINGSSDNFVVKFNNAGTRQWGTFFGGSGSNENFTGITVDPAGNIFIGGETSGTDLPVLSAFQPTYGGIQDVFLSRFNPATGFPVWCTYYGGGANENKAFVAADALGNVYMEFNATSAGLATPGSFQPVKPLITSAAVVKFTNTGSRVWCTYLGGSGTGGKTEEAGGIAVDVNNNIIVVGDTYNTDFPVTNCAYQPVFAGSEDQFITTFDPDGKLICSSFLGIGLPTSPNNETGHFAGGSVAVSGGYLFMTATTACTYPITPGAFQTLCGGKGESAFSKLCIYSCGLPKTMADFTSPTSVCAGNPVSFTLNNTSCNDVNTTYLWTFTGSVQGTSTLHDPGNITWSSPGSYTVSVKVMTPCDTIVVSKPAYITINNCNCSVSAVAAVTSTINCASANSGSVQVTVNGGTGPYSYSWSNGSNGTTTSTVIPLTGLSANTYTVTVTDGVCVTVSTVVLTQPIAVASVVPTVSCNSQSTGTAKVTISTSGSGPYTYSWSNGVSNITNSSIHQVNNLSAGTYTVSVTQGFCIVNSTVTITQAPPVTLGFTSKWLCPSNSGVATVIPSDGNPSYTYLWSNGQTSATATGFNTGTYSVTATDINGCVVTGTVTLQNIPLLVTTSSQNIACGTIGSATVNASGGTAPLTYSWSNGFSGVTTISGLTAGGYTVTISDAGGCSATRTFNITGSNPVSATFTQSPSGTVCAGAVVAFTNTGTSGSGMTYSWSISGPAPTVTGSTNDFSYTFLSTGTYSISHTVTSATPCQARIISLINVIDCSAGPTVTAAGSSVCSGICATVTSSAAGGTTPYTYSWNNGASTQNISPCPASTTTYTVTIKDAGGNTSTSTAVVTVNPVVTATTTATNITCNGASTGSATATGSNGTPGYVYNWSNGVSGSMVSGLTAGNYTVTITDSKGCTAISTAAITSPPPLAGQFTKGTAACNACLPAGQAGGCKQWIMVNGNGGTSPYSYTWSASGGIVNRYRNNLCPGTYIINIKDKNGCSINVNLTAP